MYQTKAAIKSVGIVSPVLALLVMVAQMLGLDISAEVPGITAAVAGTVDNVVILVGLVAGIYGRWTATKQISGVIRSKE